jgi:hypothetical protein
MTNGQAFLLSISMVVGAFFLLCAIVGSTQIAKKGDCTKINENVFDDAVSVLVEFGIDELKAIESVTIILKKKPNATLQEVVNEAIRR